jgi:class 3 adenylate cyclase
MNGWQRIAIITGVEHEVRYCTSDDGTRIAFCVEGEGPPLVECPRTWESFANAMEELAVYHSIRSVRTSVRYDFRGVGLSQRDPPAYTLDCMTADLEAVVRSVGFKRFVLWASTFSAAPAITFAVRHPEQVSRLILIRPIPRGADVMPPANLEALIALIRSNWEMASQAIADLGLRAGDPTAGIRAAALLRRNMEPDSLASMLAELHRSVDVRGILEDVKCPTLIIHRKDDSIFPFAGAQAAAAAIPNARLVPLKGSGQVSSGDDVEVAVQAMTAFLDEDPETRALTPTTPAHALSSTLRTVLFTDLVGHTEMMSRLGDQKGRDVLREHERITREVLKAHGGTEVKTMGDGFMASFGSVTRAVECAVALQNAFADWNANVGVQGLAPLQVRCGLNAGEPIEEDGDLFGATVILASRIASKAEGGEILAADTVRGLCSGKGFLFSDRGEFVAKGFEEPVRVYEVRWRE